jgi:hypothetical protein
MTSINPSSVYVIDSVLYNLLDSLVCFTVKTDPYKLASVAFPFTTFKTASFTSSVPGFQ